MRLTGRWTLGSSSSAGDLAERAATGLDRRVGPAERCMLAASAAAAVTCSVSLDSSAAASPEASSAASSLELFLRAAEDSASHSVAGAYTLDASALEPSVVGATSSANGTASGSSTGTAASGRGASLGGSCLEAAAAAGDTAFCGVSTADPSSSARDAARCDTIAKYSSDTTQVTTAASRAAREGC